MITGKRNIKNGNEWDRFFTKPEGDFVSVKKDAKLTDTISLMQQVVEDTLDDTKEIAKKLQGASVLLTCNRIWNFCFSHFQYEKDEERMEQVRRPARAWHDRIKGIDCDCFTVFIGSVLTNLGIPFTMRMTRYESADFEHIYPVAQSPEGDIIMDCVVHKFNYEVPYTQKKDVKMELQYLNGITGERFNEFGDKVRFMHELPIDAEDLFQKEMEFQELSGKEERQERKEERQEKKQERKENPGTVKEKLKAALKKGVNIVNKINPATALLRAGILASMKLNLFKVGSNLRFAYWTEEEAKKNEMDLAKFNQLQQIRVKLEKINFTAGGNTSSLKKSILTGKGNQDKMVQLNGFGAIISAVQDEDDLRTILGDDIFYEELSGFDGLGSLGSAVATGAAVTAATGVLATISSLIKKVGDVFKKGSKAAQKFQIKANTDDAAEKTRKFSVKNLVNKVKTKIQTKKESKALQEGEQSSDDDISVPDSGYSTGDDQIIPEDEMTDDGTSQTRSEETDTTDTGDGKEKKGVMAWIKANPVPSTLIGLAVVGGAFLGIRAYTKSKSKKGMDGIPKKKKSKKNKAAKKNKPSVKHKPAKRNKQIYSAKKVELL